MWAATEERESQMTIKPEQKKKKKTKKNKKGDIREEQINNAIKCALRRLICTNEYWYKHLIVPNIFLKFIITR